MAAIRNGLFFLQEIAACVCCIELQILNQFVLNDYYVTLEEFPLRAGCDIAIGRIDL